MKLTKGIKPEIIKIPEDIPHTITRTGTYIEIEITNQNEINKLKSKGFK